jgi:hypothetical protein
VASWNLPPATTFTLLAAAHAMTTGDCMADVGNVRLLRQHNAYSSGEQHAIELDDVRCLQEISTLLISESNIETLYDGIVDAAIALMRSDMATMQIFEPATGDLQLLRARGCRCRSFRAGKSDNWKYLRDCAIRAPPRCCSRHRNLRFHCGPSCPQAPPELQHPSSAIHAANRSRWQLNRDDYHPLA